MRLPRPLGCGPTRIPRVKHQGHSMRAAKKPRRHPPGGARTGRSPQSACRATATRSQRACCRCRRPAAAAGSSRSVWEWGGGGVCIIAVCLVASWQAYAVTCGAASPSSRDKALRCAGWCDAPVRLLAGALAPEPGLALGCSDGTCMRVPQPRPAATRARAQRCPTDAKAHIASTNASQGWHPSSLQTVKCATAIEASTPPASAMLPGLCAGSAARQLEACSSWGRSGAAAARLRRPRTASAAPVHPLR